MSNYYLDLIKKIPIAQLHKDIIVGCGLGDATFNMNPNGNASIGFDQGLPNKKYLYYLFSIMKEYTSLSGVKERIYFDKRYNKNNYSYNFRTKASSIFYPFAQLFLSKSKETEKYVKIVPNCIEDLLTPGALAFLVLLLIICLTSNFEMLLSNNFLIEYTSLIPAVKYNNPDTEKSLIIKENKMKSGIYC